MKTQDKRPDGSHINENHSGKTAQGKTIGMPDTQKNADSTRPQQTQVKQQANPSKQQWQQRVPSAQTEWKKLSEAELLQSNGDPKRLAGLVEKRYDISHSAAETQVNRFLNK
ncbi:hypothetical protein CWE22_01695 [Pseudidiomarina aestuarii]|uniref:General stress protein CsbD n=1 Tax=Pseudidiomarina aestuarii TaxID=624146 RepID=A0A7Z6ZTD3_9GAMM|nr:hypothetical protein [Pseudidiomarina aestuarii]RUO40938.1 hypothetical protein CWE22_01695 [Pseudidiomarina aestuarii]